MQVFCHIEASLGSRSTLGVVRVLIAFVRQECKCNHLKRKAFFRVTHGLHIHLGFESHRTIVLIARLFAKDLQQTNGACAARVRDKAGQR